MPVTTTRRPSPSAARDDRGSRVQRGAEAARPWGLTDREVQILRQLSTGMTARAIGHRMGISDKTVRKHLEHIYRKLGVADRLSAVIAAQELAVVIGSRDR